MFEKAPDVWGWFSLSVTWVKSNSYLYWGSFTAFLAALWSGLCDHHHPEYSGGNEKDRVTRRVDAQVGLIPPAYLPGESAINAL